MKTKLSTIITASSLLISILTVSVNNLYAVSWMDGWYIQGSGCVVSHNKQKFNTGFNPETGRDEILKFKFDAGYGAAISVGVVLCEQWRLEAEVVMRKSRIKSISDDVLGELDKNGYIQDTAIMFNVYYDIPLWCDWNAYIGGGIGVDFNQFKTRSSSIGLDGGKNSTLFAWQVSSGLSYDITDFVAFFTGYRLFMTVKEKMFADFKADEVPLVHSIDFGLRWKL